MKHSKEGSKTGSLTPIQSNKSTKLKQLQHCFKKVQRHHLNPLQFTYPPFPAHGSCLTPLDLITACSAGCFLCLASSHCFPQPLSSFHCFPRPPPSCPGHMGLLSLCSIPHMGRFLPICKSFQHPVLPLSPRCFHCFYWLLCLVEEGSSDWKRGLSRGEGGTVARLGCQSHQPTTSNEQCEVESWEAAWPSSQPVSASLAPPHSDPTAFLTFHIMCSTHTHLSIQRRPLKH